MDPVITPVSLATVTAALTVLGTKVAEGAATEAGKSIWEQAKTLLGWADDPLPAEIALLTAQQLQKTPTQLKPLLMLLKLETGTAGLLVGKIDIVEGKVLVAGNINGNVTF